MAKNKVFEAHLKKCSFGHCERCGNCLKYMGDSRKLCLECKVDMKPKSNIDTTDSGCFYSGMRF